MYDAKKLYEQAAQLGHRPSMYMLVNLYMQEKNFGGA